MRISEFKNGDAIDLLVDLIDPASKIINDSKVQEAIKAKHSKLHIAKLVLKEHKAEIIEILAMLDGKTVEEYSCTPVTIIKDLLELLSDEELVSFFSLQQAQMTTGGASTLAVESTEDAGL